MTAGTDRPEEIDPSGVRKLLRLLESLRGNPAGSIIYRQVEGMLDDIAVNHLKAEMAYAGFVSVLLEAFLTHLTPGSGGYFQIKLLQARLQPPLTPTELDTLNGFIKQCGDQIRDASALESDVMVNAISPLLAAFGIEDIPATVAVKPAEPAPAKEIPAAGPGVPAPFAEPEAAAEAEGLEPEAVVTAPETEAVAPEGGLEPGVELPPGQDLHALNRSELEARREDIEKLQSMLGQQVLETISQNEEFGVILDVVLTELRQAGDMTEIENLRWTVIREIEKLMKGHNELADKLDSTHHYLQLLESDSREMSDELTRVRLLSLTDELTSLPNRRAFMRRLEDEVARVQRYGFPMSFVLMDLDHFKDVNDKYGHAAGDEVLRVYAKNILSIFRHHDMVARYGGEEFAVLLPNTDADGAVRALNKVKKRASETRWQTNGLMANVPTFSAGVSLYKPGESISAFIERADKALYRAKRLGRDRIELDMTYESENQPRRRRTDT
jgi:diguanylate cyclase (GGDEF)-like protein